MNLFALVAKGVLLQGGSSELCEMMSGRCRETVANSFIPTHMQVTCASAAAQQCNKAGGTPGTGGITMLVISWSPKLCSISHPACRALAAVDLPWSWALLLTVQS